MSLVAVVKDGYGTETRVYDNQPHRLHLEIATFRSCFSQSFDYEGAKMLHDAIGEIVEQIRPKTKKQWRVVYGQTPPTDWCDRNAWAGTEDIATFTEFRRIETREVPA